MITFFATAKPFTGHSGIIQRNALKSWRLLHPDAEVILFGDDAGAAEVCAEFGLRHEQHVERHESGMKYLNYMFERAQAIARHPILCYSNCDIIFCEDYLRAIQLALSWRSKFLIVGQRWDADVIEPVDFFKANWQDELRNLARSTGTLQSPYYVDYFAFRKGLYDEVPPLVVGRSYWDWWLVWKAMDRKATVVDCTEAVVAVHQNHGHGYHPLGKQGTNEDALAQRNATVAGGRRHMRYTLDASHKIDANGKIRRVALRRQYYEWRIAYKIQTLINITHPVRRVLGLRRSSLKKTA